MKLEVMYMVRDEGTIVVFSGLDDEGRDHWFAADHRPAQAIVAALEDDEPVEVEVEPWQLVGA